MSRHPARPRQRGAFVVEFALVATLFLMLLFMILEIARALYMMNTLQEVTRRAARGAATMDFTDTSAIAAMRRHAVLNSTGGKLPFGAPVTDANVVIDYMSLRVQGSTVTPTPIAAGDMPNCPARNRLNCTDDSSGGSCVRFVRVRVCKTGTSCDPIAYESLSGLATLPFDLPMATTIVRAESLGYKPGMPMCN